MENKEAVDFKLAELNKGLEPPEWFAVDGYYSMLATSMEGSSVTFHADKGLPLKPFLNKVSGEIRFFPAKAFERPPV